MLVKNIIMWRNLEKIQAAKDFAAAALSDFQHVWSPGCNALLLVWLGSPRSIYLSVKFGACHEMS